MSDHACADIVERLLSNEIVPMLPNGLHWLGDREAADSSQHAVDTTGCVMYFDQQSDCLQFMRWLSTLSRPHGEAEPKPRKPRYPVKGYPL